MKNCICLLLATLYMLEASAAVYENQFLDCPGNWPMWGILRRCCRSDQLPNDCECFDISGSSGFTNTMYHRPQCPDKLNIIFTLFTRSNRNNGFVLRAGDQFPSASPFEGSRPTKFVTHGFTDSGDDSWVLDTKDALLDVEDLNVITVDWQNGAKGPNYYQAAANTRTVGAMIARLILDFNQKAAASFDKFHLIGHSLGAHVMGSAGTEIYRLTGQLVSRITGLDPAGPAFENSDIYVRLDQSDAEFVDVIHTDSEPLLSSGFGIRRSVGHVDFRPNGGVHQPGCAKETLGILSMVNFADEKESGACSHARAIFLFLSSIRGCVFPGAACNMGYRVSRTCRGDQQPATKDVAPYC